MILASYDAGGSETIYVRLRNHCGGELWNSEAPLRGLSEAMMKSYFILENATLASI